MLYKIRPLLGWGVTGCCWLLRGMFWHPITPPLPTPVIFAKLLLLHKHIALSWMSTPAANVTSCTLQVDAESVHAGAMQSNSPGRQVSALLTMPHRSSRIRLYKVDGRGNRRPADRTPDQWQSTARGRSQSGWDRAPMEASYWRRCDNGHARRPAQTTSPAHSRLNNQRRGWTITRHPSNPARHSAAGATALHLRRRRFRSQSFDVLGRSRQKRSRILWEVCGVRVWVEVVDGNVRSDCQPAGTDCRVLPEEMQPASAEAEVLDDVEYFHRFFRASSRLVFGDDQVDVDIGVDEVSVCAASHSASNPHQAVFLTHTKTLRLTSHPVWPDGKDKLP